MGRQLVAPVHLYVKIHRVTGLKCFGRTTENPSTYKGSGAYWTRHLERYGDAVDTRLVGTYTDADELRARAQSFSRTYDVANSTDWANLLPEDGDTNGEGWSPSQDFSAKIAALDAAVQRNLAAKNGSGQTKQQAQQTEADDKKDDAFMRVFIGCLVVLAVIAGIYTQQTDSADNGYADGFQAAPFLLGLLVVAMTPVGWIAAGAAAWVITKLFGSES